VLIELFMDSNGSLVDVWVTALAIPGFLGGAVFSIRSCLWIEIDPPRRE
jgi:hypothetical protein